MIVLETLCWLCGSVVAYTYILYPILLVIANNLIRKGRQVGPVQATVSILVPVHNEEANLARRLDELTRSLTSAGIAGEIIVISDGSTDRTVEIARGYADRGVRVIELPEKQGKAVALSAGAAEARCEIMVFADARQRWADDALTRLIENFADPGVGAVSGDLVLESGDGVLAGVGLYWQFEKWLRMQESQLGSQVGVTGAICAVRRALFRPIPAGTLLDDVYWPMHVVLQGYRVVHDERAQAFDRLPDDPHDEFRRKVRTLAGNYQLLTLLPVSALFPWGNGVWWQWVSHKLMRLAVPWALIGMLLSSAVIGEISYQIFFLLQALGYGLAALGLVPAIGEKVKPLGTAASFLVLNAAAWLAFWVWITGRAEQSWHKAQYQDNASPP
ncbi:MAG: glycosyltransferase family 2 protein [Planctomycetes bacterium]|nr:glycosyltransferase family 2 protein [Planctomycetota bacterium]